MFKGEYKFIQDKPVNDFTIHQRERDKGDNCKSVMCKKCKGDKFFVGKGSYYTAISCENCGWQLCVHAG